MEETNGKKKAVVITYNTVDGYKEHQYTGRNWYMYSGRNWDVIVYSHADSILDPERNQYRLENIINDVKGESDPDRVYVYAGRKHMMNSVLHTAVIMAEKGVEMRIVTCGCDWNYKKNAAEEMGVPLINSECGGNKKLKNIVDGLLSA